MISAFQNVDIVEAGTSGPLVILVHSSAAGARQWRRLIDYLKPDFLVRAVNLFGYGGTPSWPMEITQTLDDQADLIETAIEGKNDVFLVGHSFGGSVAMKAAARLGKQVKKLVLLETNPFYLLAQNNKSDAFAEAMALRNCVKKNGAADAWMTAAETFADYWNGSGSWASMSLERRAAFADALKPNFSEWDAVMDERTTVEDWARLLPEQTLQVVDPQTVLPIREISEILRKARPDWKFVQVPGAGHMAPLTHPDLINPIVRSFLG